MKVTRDVIYDLLPAYFAGETSTDTRNLIEEFFATDVEFGRMAGRFRELLDDKNRSSDVESESVRERRAFDRARLATELPFKARTAAAIWGMASAFAWFIALVTWNERMGFWNPGVLIGACFLVGAVVTFVASFYVTPESPWRAWVGLDDETLRSM